MNNLTRIIENNQNRGTFVALVGIDIVFLWFGIDSLLKVQTH